MIILLLLLLAKIEDTEQVTSLKIDAMLPVYTKSTEEILIFSGDKIYKYNIQTKVLADPLPFNKYFENISLPLIAASLNKRKKDFGFEITLLLVNSSDFHHLYHFSVFNESKTILENASHRKLYKAAKQIGEFALHLSGMASDTSRPLDEDYHIFACSKRALFSADIPKGSFWKATAVELSVTEAKAKNVKNCTGLAMAFYRGKHYLVMGGDNKLRMFEANNGQLKLDKIENTLDMQEDVLGQTSWTGIIVLALVLGIAVFLLLNAIVVGVVLYRRKRKLTKSLVEKSSSESKEKSPIVKKPAVKGKAVKISKISV